MTAQPKYQLSVRTSDSSFVILPADSLVGLLDETYAMHKAEGRGNYPTFREWLVATDKSLQAVERAAWTMVHKADMLLANDAASGYEAYMERRTLHPADHEVLAYAAQTLNPDGVPQASWQIHPSDTQNEASKARKKETSWMSTK